MLVVVAPHMMAINAALITQVTAAVKCRVRIQHFTVVTTLWNAHTVVITWNRGEITDSNQFVPLGITAQEGEYRISWSSTTNHSKPAG